MASSGNFGVLNPSLRSVTAGMNGGTFSEGNLKYAMSGEDGFRGNYAMTHKTYCEVYINSIGNYGGTIGFGSYQNKVTYNDMVTFQMNYQSGRIYHYKGSSEQNAGSNNAGSTVSAGQVVMMAYDPATYKWWIGINGSWNGSQDPANDSNPCFTGSATMFEDMQGVFWGGWKGSANGLTCHWNFGQDSTFGGTITAGGNADGNGFGDFKYTPPTGFLALCSGNEVISSDIDPAQTDDSYPGKNLNVVTYTGDGSTSNAISNLGFSPDLVWIGQRSSPTADYSNGIWDTTRGRAKLMYSSRSNAEPSDSSSTQDLVSFDSDGFTVGTNNNASVNASSKEMVGWCWKANGGTTSSDSSGDITVTRQSNTKGGFSILTYTGNGSADQTIAHGLGATPAFIITKNRSSSSHWAVWHQSHTGYYGQLEDTGSWASDSSQFYTDGMTSNFIGVKGSGATNESGDNMLAYVWTEIDGYSRFGSYLGNGNSDGPYVYTGLRPRLLMIRNVEQSSNWGVYDSARQTFNPNENYLRWNSGVAEGGTSTSFDVDFLSNGFKVRSTETDLNTSGKKFIYTAWGDVPFKYNNTF